MIEFCSEQLEWIENDLAQSVQNRSIRPWLIVFMHRPMYCSNKDQENCHTGATVLKVVLEDLFAKYQVDLVITAHKHNYERTLPVYQENHIASNYTNSPFPVYIVNGAGGNREGTSGWPSSNWTPPSWSAFRYSEWGYGVIDIASPSELNWTFYNSETNDLVDQFTMTK